MMKLFLAAAAVVSVGATLPSLTHAQVGEAPPAADSVAPGGIREQLDQLSGRVDRGLQKGQLTQDEADRARRRINDIGAQMDTDRERDGGRLSEADRFDLLAQVNRLNGQIHWQRTEATASPSDWTLERREHWMETRIERATLEGRLSGNEEERGRTELQAIRGEQARLAERDGGTLSGPDTGYLSSRIDELNRTLRWTGENPPPPWSM